MSATLVSIHLGDQKGAGKQAVEEAELVAGYGIRGDRHAGRDEDRHVSLFDEEVRQEMIGKGFDVPAEMLSANLLTRGLPLDSLQPGDSLRIGEIEIEITERRKPCRSITRIDHRLTRLLVGRCGFMARVVSGGIARPGQAIELIR